MYLKGRNTVLNYVRFCIPSCKLNDHYSTINKTTKFILNTNNIRVVDSVGKIILQDDLTPKGFVVNYLLFDESYLSTYAYTNKSSGKLTINFFTKSVEPLNHYNALADINKFFTERYFCILDKF